MSEWQPIETARPDGTMVWVYAPAYADLPAIQCLCAYHPDAGWCVDELRVVTHWRPLRTVWLAPPDSDVHVLVQEIDRLRAVVQNATDTVDAILRGNHAGWDQRLAALRTALSNTASSVQAVEW